MKLDKKSTLIKSFGFLTSFCLIILFFCGCNKEITPYKTTTLAMGTVISQSIYGENAQEISKKITSEIENLENSNLSWRIDGSDINRVNSNAGNFVKVDSYTADWIKKCLDVSKNCGGVFDISIGNLTGLWNIGSDDARLPSKQEIESAIKTIDYTAISISGSKVKCAPNQKIDLGAIGKGAACDRVSEILDKAGSNSAIISVGGSILLYGQNPNADKWSVGIRNPRGEANEYMAILNLDECCVSTSGDYERVFEQDGVSYHHILDPRTGYPSKNDIISVTVVCDSGVLSDALSTACFILGYKDSIDLLKTYNAQAVFIDKDFKVYVTSDLQNNLTITNDTYKIVKG
ncbi:MAG: FAD:protein FMN transferase [Clostridia bacterium]|nr:FAD:protein FMN transferase [Clostridia bacterium]